MKEADPQAALVTPIVLGKDEMNLAEYPLSILTHRIPRDRKTYSFTQRITDHEGTLVKQSWSVLGSDKYGLPTPYDDDVLIALLYCYKEQKPQGKQIHFSLYKLCQIMRKALSKREYDRMRDALNRLTSTTIVATNCFYDNLAKSWVSEAFHLFDRYKLYQERKGRAASPHLSFVEMSEFFYRSVAVANYIKDLDLGIYYTLALPISKRLFRYLDKNRYKKRRYEETVMRMAYKLPLTYAYPSQVKQKLAPAHEELLRHGYLTRVAYDVTREGEEKVIYEFADGETRTGGSSMVEDGTAGQLVLDFYTQLTGTCNLAYDPAPKEVALAQSYLVTYGPERAAFVVRHTVKAAKAADFPIQTFGGTKNFLPQALAAWEGRAEAEEAQREAEARVNEQRRRERDERERRRRLADRRASLSGEALAALKRRAEEALAADGVARTRLGYEVLVKLKLDDLLLEARGMGDHSGRDAAPDAITLQVAGEEINHEGL
jgi:phosphoglycolate phosphatase-like HAD superfamily hydrolase